VKKTKKKVKKAKKTTRKGKKYNLLMYVEDCNPKIKRFDSPKEVGEFICEFNKKHPDYMSPDSDNWIDYCILGVVGEVHFFTDGLKVQ